MFIRCGNEGGIGRYLVELQDKGWDVMIRELGDEEINFDTTTT